MRKLPNWLEAYEEYTHETESSPIFNKWVGISTIASALQKKCWLGLGRLKVFPNLYVVLVAEPGVARKSQAISYATDIINCVPEIVVAADSTTAQSLFQELEESTKYFQLPSGEQKRHASISVISKEFESFLSSANSSKMIVTLTDLFDAGESPWRHRTKSYGTSTIPSVFLNILGATTPRSLLDSLSSLAIGGGLTSRILFVHSEKKHKKIAVPELTPRVRELKELLITDLNTMSNMVGEWTYTPDALSYWKEWYENYDESSERRLQPRKEFDGWYSRKPLMSQKLAIILAASSGNSKEITTANVVDSLNLLLQVEFGMGKVITEEVASHQIKHADLLLKYIKQYNSLSEKHLLQLVWRDITEEEFDVPMTELLKAKKCSRSFIAPDGSEAIWYTYTEEDV